MSARNRMTMRCDVNRDVPRPERDRNNNPVMTDTTVHKGLACYCWTSTERLITSAERVVTLAVNGMIAPLEADLQELDRVLSMKDRRGRELFPAMKVASVVRRETHQELTLEEVS